MRILAITVTALWLCAACQTPDTAEYDVAKVDKDGEELICKKVRVTGELVPREVCKTQAQIKEDRQSGGRLQPNAIGVDGTGQGPVRACDGKPPGC
ncbi:hypothetical protein [Euryhalocaulis caribicus]|uniref:hypothetical protein n=1 Tax=Euryhalocaulis caribicus TaxID=1161401 RepID=UPI00039DA723|nr:hypothetical protein [Euryhalocaulis caribicus]